MLVPDLEVSVSEALPVISLFSGAGGLDLAVERADAEPLVAEDPGSGIARVHVATDYNAPALATLANNFPHATSINGDIRSLPSDQLLEIAGLRSGEPTVVVGGPP